MWREQRRWEASQALQILQCHNMQCVLGDKCLSADASGGEENHECIRKESSIPALEHSARLTAGTELPGS